MLLIVNPVSGAIDKSEFIDAATLFAAKENLNIIFYTTSGEDDISKIKSLYQQYNPERIVVAGGDGTIKMVAEAVEGYDVIIGILPAGSSNGLSVDLNLPVTLEENLRVAFLNNYAEMDMICINDKKSIHLSDIGLNADLVKNYEENELRGFLGYVTQVYTTLQDSVEPFVASITANDTTVEHAARMIVIANSQKYGTGVIINPNGSMNDGKFELIVLKNFDLLMLERIMNGDMTINSDDIVVISTEKATIKIDRWVNFQMDGEYCGTQNHLEIHVLHKQMKIAVP